MAFATVLLTNGIEVKKAPIGFSVTTLFFGGIVGLIRRDWLWGISLCLLSALTGGIAAVIAAFFYNKVYIKSLIARGWKVNAMHGTTLTYLRMYTGYLEIPLTNDFVRE